MNDCIFYTEFQDGHATIIDCKLRDDGATYPTYHPECRNCTMHTTAREAAELVRQKRGERMTKNDVIKLIEDTLQEFYDCGGGDAAFIFDDETYYTDTGYAIEGIEAFVDRIKRKLSEE